MDRMQLVHEARTTANPNRLQALSGLDDLGIRIDVHNNPATPRRTKLDIKELFNQYNSVAYLIFTSNKKGVNQNGQLSSNR